MKIGERDINMKRQELTTLLRVLCDRELDKDSETFIKELEQVKFLDKDGEDGIKDVLQVLGLSKWFSGIEIEDDDDGRDGLQEWKQIWVKKLQGGIL